MHEISPCAHNFWKKYEHAQNLLFCAQNFHARNFHAQDFSLCTKSPVHKISRARNCMHKIGSSKSDARNFHARNRLLPKRYMIDSIGELKLCMWEQQVLLIVKD